MTVPATILLERLFSRLAELQASDLHLTVGVAPVVRVGGKLMTLTDEEVMTPTTIEAIMAKIMTDEQRKTFEAERRMVFTYDFASKARFKVDVFFQRGFPSASLRYIEPRMKTVEELGLPPVVAKLADAHRGILIVSGTFGSGRSTTMTALVQHINMSRAAHIVTIENPIEQIFVNGKSIIEQREVGRDTLTFEAALENIYQEDVDVVVLTEAENPKVLDLMLKVAESGRLVVTSMSADSASRTVEKIIAMFPPHEQERVRSTLSETLVGVVTQRLLPRTGGGVILVAEVLTATRAIRSVIHDGATHQIDTILETSREEGMMPFDAALAARVSSGDLGLDDALAAAHDPNTVKQMLHQVRGF